MQGNAGGEAFYRLGEFAVTPFSCGNIPNYILNAKIALFVFRNVICYVAAKSGKTAKFNEAVIKDIYYSFCFRDMSKESIMVLAESLIG